MKILLAEDESFLRKMLSLDLEDHGATVRCAKDGEDALAQIEQEKPDLLLLDLIMPRKDGFAVLKHLQEKGYAFPIIVLSNLSDPAQQQRTRELGAKDFLIKSNLGIDEVWTKVEEHFAKA
jgi:DNA-binding response OmpR family regulator